MPRRVVAIAVLTIGLVLPPAIRLTGAETFGDWVVETKSEGAFAASMNDSGNAFGQFCNPAERVCFWVIALTQNCTENHRYPVLANSDAGAVPLQVVCRGYVSEGKYRYVFTEFEAVDRIVRQGSQGSRIGFAIPLQGGDFIAVRFALRGAVSAIDKMRADAESRIPPSTSGTKDKRL